jgi:hypothetical protein
VVCEYVQGQALFEIMGNLCSKSEVNNGAAYSVPCKPNDKGIAHLADSSAPASPTIKTEPSSEVKQNGQLQLQLQLQQEQQTQQQTKVAPVQPNRPASSGAPPLGERQGQQRLKLCLTCRRARQRRRGCQTLAFT